MINFNAEIISGKSIGGICIGTSIDQVLQEVYLKGYDLEIKEFSNNPIPVKQYSIEGGIIKVISTDDGIVKSISCNSLYTGKYADMFATNMTVGEVIDESVDQIYLHGTLIVNKDFGVGYTISDDFDHLDYVHQLPRELVLEEMFVLNKDWWKV